MHYSRRWVTRRQSWDHGSMFASPKVGWWLLNRNSTKDRYLLRRCLKNGSITIGGLRMLEFIRFKYFYSFDILPIDKSFYRHSVVPKWLDWQVICRTATQMKSRRTKTKHGLYTLHQNSITSRTHHSHRFATTALHHNNQIMNNESQQSECRSERKKVSFFTLFPYN